MRLYAYTYPQEVAGMVLVDASHEDAFVRFPTLQQDLLDGQKQLSMCSGLAPFGVIRLFGFLDKFILQYPSAMQPQVKALFYQTRFCGTWYDEGASWDESTTQVYAARDIPARSKFRLDRLYAPRQTLCFDLKLIAVSVWITLRGRWEKRGKKL